MDIESCRVDAFIVMALYTRSCLFLLVFLSQAMSSGQNTMKHKKRMKPSKTYKKDTRDEIQFLLLSLFQN